MDIKILGKYKGKTVQSYRIENKNGTELEVLNLGGIIRTINYRGKNRVLNFDDYRAYIEDDQMLGATIGPVAGIGPSRSYPIDLVEGKSYKCEGEYLGKQMWTLYETVYNGIYESFSLVYTAEDGEGGYPGRRKFFVKFTLTEEDEIIIEYRARTDRDTYVNLSNHSYFNFHTSLEDDILDHELFIDADKYIVLDGDLKPKSIEDVEGTIFDFRQGKKIGKDFDLNSSELKHTKGYNHPFILKKEKNNKEIILTYKDIKMGIETREPVLVLYTGNGLKKRHGVCLKTQWYPGGKNKGLLTMPVLSPGEEYRSRTIYRFL